MLRYKSIAEIPSHLLPAELRPQTPVPAANDPEFTPKRRKYGNVPVEVDGRKIPSKAQARRYQYLKLAAATGAIHGFVSEVSVLLPGGTRMRLDELVNEDVPYPCEQCGHENMCPTLVFEDTKGVITEAWEVKRRALEAALGVKVRIIRAGRAANDEEFDPIRKPGR